MGKEINAILGAQTIWTYIVAALDETNIFGCLHFSLHNIELCDIGCACGWSNFNNSQCHSLFIDVCVKSFTHRHSVLFKSFTLTGCSNTFVTNRIIHYMGAQWLSGRVLDLRPRGRGLKPHRCHCVVVLEQDTFILA